MAKFGAGQLRHKVKIQKQETTANSMGEQVVTWVDYSSSVRARIEPQNMNEAFASDQILTKEQKIFTIRYRSGIEPKQRIIYNDIPYNIESIIDENERHHMLTLLAFRVTT